MNLFDFFKRGKQCPQAEAAPAKSKMAIHATVQAMANMPVAVGKQGLARHEPPAGVIPQGMQAAVAAMDATPYDYVNAIQTNGSYFVGYPILVGLAQRPEHRKIVSTLAEEHTRKWIALKYSGETDATERLEALEAAMKRYRLREVFKDALEHDGFFGRGQIYIDVKTPDGARASDNSEELSKLLAVDKAKVAKGGLLAFRAVEPVWTYPGHYQSINPLAPNYYRPDSWYIMGKAVHASRLLTIISRPVPDMLKPAYNFGGIPLTQLLDPYVNNWLRTRDSVSDLVHSFSTSILKTNMGTVLSGHPDQSIFARADLFNKTRDNRGLMMLDAESEDLMQVNTPLSTLDALQAQSQEHMASISGIPLVKLLGTQPAGLNASSDGEIRVFYDTIAASQQDNLRPLIKKALDIIQLSEFGEIDPGIDFDFLPLYQMDEAQQATIRKTEADTDAVYIQAGVLDPSEVRQRLASDPDSPYDGLDPDDMPEMPDMGIGGEALKDEETGANPFAADSGEWDESKHPRAENGQFGSGGGGEGKQSANRTDLSSLFQIATTNKGGNKAYSDFAEVSPETVEAIARATGQDATGWKHSIGEADIRHILKKHGNEHIENKRGQRAVTQRDIEQLPHVLSSFDEIVYSGTNGAGNDMFLVRKLVGDEVFCAQEVWTGRKKLAVKSMWIRKNKSR